MTTKNYLKIPMLLLTIGLLTSCSYNNDWKRDGLNGKVKTYFERYYEAEMKFGEWENGDIDFYGHLRVSYDSEGNCQWTDYLDDENELFIKAISKRENGELIESDYYDSDGELMIKTKFIHNSKDELEYIEYDVKGERISQGKSYFANNRIIKAQYQRFEDDKEEKEYTTVFEYDKDGNVLSEKQTDKKGEITYFKKYEYLAFDENKNWTKKLIYDSEAGEEPINIVIREYEYY